MSWQVAAAVPPVARTSSTTYTASPGTTPSSWISRAPVPYSSELADGRNVIGGDLRVLVWAGDSRLTFTPVAGRHVASFGGESYRIVSIARRPQVGDEVLAYELQLRGGE